VSLVRSARMTPARILANRRNAQKSTGPRTEQGKAHSRMNRLRTGNRSPLLQDFILTWLNAPPELVNRVGAPACGHPLFAERLEMFRQAEAEVAEQFDRQFAMSALYKQGGFKNLRTKPRYH